MALITFSPLKDVCSSYIHMGCLREEKPGSRILGEAWSGDSLLHRNLKF